MKCIRFLRNGTQMLNTKYKKKFGKPSKSSIVYSEQNKHFIKSFYQIERNMVYDIDTKYSENFNIPSCTDLF